jgi:hypothetical protein
MFDSKPESDPVPVPNRGETGSEQADVRRVKDPDVAARPAAASTPARNVRRSGSPGAESVGFMILLGSVVASLA